MCVFHLEQALQLLIKAKFLEVKGSYPRTHSLRRLLLKFTENWKREEVVRFLDEYRVILRSLERTHISSRFRFYRTMIIMQFL
uniref:HEPN domain-containing protein n=1 Tax=Ignisphaera aggregans TaxID=334771 RepID=A0A7C5Z0F6_9CREN